MPERRARGHVPAGHPCLAGHFPGNPVVPGAVLLERVLDAVQAEHGGHWRLRQVLAAKFLAPLRPGESFEIVLLLAGACLEWRCERDARLIAHGSWILDAVPPSAAAGAGDR